MSLFIRCLGVVLLMAMLFSCRSTKKIQTAISRKDTTVVIAPPVIDAHADSVKFMKEAYAAVLKNWIDFQTFSAKVKVDFEGKDGKKSDFNAFLRLRKDSALWISVNVALGIEAFRVLITPDSVKVLNKIDKIVQLRSVSALQEMTQLPFTFTELQNVIIGNPVFLDSTILSYNTDESSVSLFILNEFFRHMLTVNRNNYTLQNSKLDDTDPSRARTCLVVYSDYQQKDNKLFSAFRKITVTEKNKLDIQMEYKQFGFNEELNFPFSIPKNYKRQ